MWKFWQSIVFLKDEELDQLEESVEVLIHGYNKFFENGKLKRKNLLRNVFVMYVYTQDAYKYTRTYLYMLLSFFLIISVRF